MEALRAIAFGIGTLAAIWAVERALAWLSWTLAGPFPAREEMAVLFSFLIVLAVIYGGIWLPEWFGSWWRSRKRRRSVTSGGG